MRDNMQLLGPLIVPGDYNFSYNQTYLLAKLPLEWFQTALFWAVLIFVVYKIYKYCRREQANSLRQDGFSKLKREIIADLKATATIVKCIEEDKMLFTSDVSILKRRYKNDLDQCILRLIGCDDMIFTDGELRPYARDYSKAKGIFMEWK